MEHEIEKVLNGLLEAISNETEEESKELIDKLLKSKYLNWKDPDNVNVMYFYQLSKHLPALFKRVYPNVNNSRICFIYENYSFLDNNIRKLVDFGMGCCADKTRWVIEQYLKKTLGEEISEIPERNDKSHRYSHPDFATINQWMDYAESLYNLFYGKYEGFHEIYSKLESEKKEVEKVLMSEAVKINIFYKESENIINELISEGVITKEIPNVMSLCINLTQLLKNDIVEDSVTKEKIINAIDSLI